jgi:hypothetical protein
MGDRHNTSCLFVQNTLRNIHKACDCCSVFIQLLDQSFKGFPYYVVLSKQSCVCRYEMLSEERCVCRYEMLSEERCVCRYEMLSEERYVCRYEMLSEERCVCRYEMPCIFLCNFFPTRVVLRLMFCGER